MSRVCRRSYIMPSKKEEGPRGNPVGDHDDQPALEAVHGEGEDPQDHEPHVGHGGVGHQLLGVGLNRRHPRRVDDPDDPQNHHEGDDRGVLGRRREEGEKEPEEPVGPHLQEHRRQDHRSRRGRLHVGVGEPGVEREHRHLDGEGQAERREEPELFLKAQRRVQQSLIGEGRFPDTPWAAKNRYSSATSIRRDPKAVKRKNFTAE